MSGFHESRLRAAVAGVRDADVLSEMAVGWRTAIAEIKVSERRLQRVLTGLEDREQLGRRTREAATTSLTEMADHLREQRRVLAGTARALDEASTAMGRAVRLMASWDRAGAPVVPGPPPQPDPLAKPGDDQTAYLSALSEHSRGVTAYNDAVNQREEAARREMENLDQVFAHAEERIRVHHDIPVGRLTDEQKREEEERRRREEEERRRREEEERRRREEEERRRREEEERRRREEEERRQREEDLDRYTRPPSQVPGHLDDPGSSLPSTSHTGISHLAGSSGPALITSVSAEAQGGVALSSPASPAGAPAPVASSPGTLAALPLAPGGSLTGPGPSSGALGGTPSPSIGATPPAVSARAAGSPTLAPATSAARATARAGGRGPGSATAPGQVGRGGAGATGAGSRSSGSSAGSTRGGRRGGRGEEKRGRQDLLTTDSSWFDDDEAAPGVLE